MARIRTVKPEFWTDSTMVQLPHFARLFYVALWTAADDYGYIRDEPDRLAMELMPREGVDDVDEALQLLYACGRLEWIVAEDFTSYYRIAKWEDHQKIDHPSKSRILRESSRKVTIPLDVRRDVAKKYGCEPGGQAKAQCFYCGSDGRIRWFIRKDGKPSSWVVFPGLELDHVESEVLGGQTVSANIVLACRSCNRSKGAKHWFDFLTSPPSINSSRASSRVLALEGKGKEHGKEEEGKGSETPDSLMQAVATELRVTDRWQKVSCSEQIKLAMLAGESGKVIAERMIDSGHKYRAGPDFKFGGWKKFFADGLWSQNGTESQYDRVIAEANKQLADN